MANLLQSTQQTTTNAPSFYTDYLSNLANLGTAAAQNAKFIGATPLQQQAFENVGTAGTAYQPTLNAAGETLQSAAGSTSPLSAASGYLTQATQSPAEQAASYVSPWLKGAVQSLSDINQTNILNNLSPAATAGAVGSGQFGSQRGAQVLGQTEAQANQALNSQIAQLLNTGYGQALTTAEQQNQLLGQLGSTAGTAASQGQQNLTQAGTAQGNLAAQNQNLSLADINALATLGQQQQTIGQNQQLFPLTTLSTLSGLMQGQTVPTSTSTQLNTSPLSAVASLGSLATGLFTPTKDASGNMITPWSQLTGALSGSLPNISSIFGSSSGSGTGTETGQNVEDYLFNAANPSNEIQTTSPTEQDVLNYMRNEQQFNPDAWGEAP